MDIYKAIREGKYDNRELYPGPKPKKPILLKGYEGLQAIVENEWLAKLAVYTAAKKKYQDAQNGTMANFKADALQYVGLTDHPKASKAYDLAWDDGHSAGISEVLACLETLAELLLD